MVVTRPVRGRWPASRAISREARVTLTDRVDGAEKSKEIAPIPDLLGHLAETKQIEGAVVTIDGTGCKVAIANKIVPHKAGC